jgi:hypothetical protein
MLAQAQRGPMFRTRACGGISSPKAIEHDVTTKTHAPAKRALLAMLLILFLFRWESGGMVVHFIPVGGSSMQTD